MGQLPGNNLGMFAINREGYVSQPWYSPSNLSMNTIGNSLAPYLDPVYNPYAISSYLNWQLPTTSVGMSQNDGGIWDGCNFWDTWCDITSDDPDFNGQNAWSGNFMYNSERGSNNGTFLTFGGGNVKMSVHGRNAIYIYHTIAPVGAPPCTPIFIEIRVDGVQVACSPPDPYNYVTLSYTIPSADPGGGYDVECNVLYGAC